MNIEIKSLAEIEKLGDRYTYNYALNKALNERGADWDNDRVINDYCPGAMIDVVAQVSNQGQRELAGVGSIAQTFAASDYINFIKQELIPVLPNEHSILDKLYNQYEVFFGHALGIRFCHSLPLGNRKIYIRQTPKLPFVESGIASEQGLAEYLRKRRDSKEGLLDLNVSHLDYLRLINLRLLGFQNYLRSNPAKPQRDEVVVIIINPTPPLVYEAARARTFDGKIVTIPHAYTKRASRYDYSASQESRTVDSNSPYHPNNRQRDMGRERFGNR